MTNIKRFLTLFFIATLGMTVWGADVEFTPTSMGGWTKSAGGQSGTKSGVTLAVSNGIVASDESEFRFYSGATMTISSSSTITQIAFTISSGSLSLKSGSPGTYNSSTKKWTGSGTNIQFSNSGQVKFTRIVVTTSGGASYTVTLNKNGSTSDITGCSGTYTLPTTGEHVANACEGWAWYCWANEAYSTSSPTTTAPSSTVITTMTGAGTAYAVYKHEEAGGGPSNVTFTAGTDKGSTTSTSADEMTKGGVTISSTSAGLAYDEYRFYSGTITISSTAGNITSIGFTCTTTGYADVLGNGTVSAGSISSSSTTATWTGNSASFTLQITAQSRVSAIIVTTSNGITTTYTSSPECVECLTKVTLTKGEESHGTFTLDKSNGEYNNCTSNFVVTVSGITPASGYYCTGVTATGEHCSVTGPDGSGNYTVTYEMGNAVTSTITANFAPNPTYTVTWSMNGDESNQDSFEEGQAIVFPITATGCDGKVFRGWSASPVEETDVEPSYVTSATMPAHAITYYAVYATLIPGSGTTATYEFAITSSDFSGSGYDSNNGEHTSTATDTSNPSNTMTVTWVSNNVSSSSGTQWRKSNGYIYNSTDLGKINSVTLSGDALSIYYGTSEEPTGTSLGSNDGYFKVANETGGALHTTSVTVNFTRSGGSPDTYSEFTTTCGAGISAQNVGWITTSAGQKVKRVISVSAKNFEDDVTLAATCANSHFAVTLGATAVPSGTTGLTTTLTVEYTPTDEGREENVEIVLTAGDKSRTITVNGRCVPDEFLLITKKSDKWYALPANMTGGANEYDGVEVNPNNTTTPTAVAVSPTTIIYSLASVANSRYADNGHLVRLVGNSNKCLWGNKATGATKVNIQNYAALSESNGDNYEWDLKTTDGVHYFVESPCNAEYAEGRRLAYGTKFGMYEEDTEFFIVSAGCSSQPGEVAVSPRRVEATFSWVGNTTEMHIDLYTNDAMTEGHLAATASSSPYVFTGLEESKPYWYKLTPGTDAACAVTGSFTTTGPLIDIVEWQENGVVLFIDKGEINPKIVIDGQEEHGSITGGGEATELFFAKYFEGAGNMKLLSIFNGTKEPISLANYQFEDHHAGSGAASYGSTKIYDLSSLGSINAGQEIIFFSRPQSTETDLKDCSDAFLDAMAAKSAASENPRWIECAKDKFADKIIEFNGNDALVLRKDGDIIDIIGALGKPAQNTNCKSEDAWDGRIKNMDKGKSPSDPAFTELFEASNLSPVSTSDSTAILNAFGINLEDEEIDITSARCIFFRDKRVTSGDSATIMNAGNDFKTFTTHIEGGVTYTAEWYGRSVCMTTADRTAAGVTSDAKPTCNSYQDIANMDYNQYYIDWHNIEPGKTLDKFSSDPETKEYTIPIDNMRQYACLNLRFQLVNGGNVLTEASQQVPIVVVGNDVDTNDPLFSELVIDQSTHLPSYSHSVERCKDCDVVVLGAASLTKGSNTDPKDVPEVGNVKVYPGGKLVVPTGTNYTMKSLAFRRQEDEVATSNIEGNITFSTPSASPAPARKEVGEKPIRKTPTGEKKTYFDLRVDPTNWHYFSLPYDCNVADIRYANPEETAIPVLGTDFLIKWYNGEKRAATQAGGCWEMVGSDATLKAGLGYIFSIPGEGSVRREFRFPMDNEVIAQEKGDKLVNSVYGYGCDKSMTVVRANHRGWNLLGNPYLLPYTSDIENPIMTGYIVEDHSTDPWDGHFKFADDARSNLRYIVEPINNGWAGYQQVSIADYEMKPFTSYFVQVGAGDPMNPDPEAAQGVEFHLARVDRSPIRRAPAEYEEVEDTHPVWCAVTLTSPKGEKDETTMLISNDFTDGYDMMNDLIKWRGTYYQYTQITTAPVLASRNNEGEMAFNALPDSSALAGIPLNYFAASQGFYTIAYDDKYDKDLEVKEVKLWDKTTNQWYDLMSEPYSFSTARTDNNDRFILSVRIERKQKQTPTDLENVGSFKGDKPRKLLINGHVYIQRGNAIYDVTGKQLLNR